MVMYYGRNRENFFSQPSSVVEGNEEEKFLLIQSVIDEKERINSKTKDINQLLLEAFEDNHLSDICQSREIEKLIGYLIDKKILVPQNTADFNDDSRGWYNVDSFVSVQTYVAGHTIVGSAAAVVVAAITVAVGAAIALVIRKPDEENQRVEIELKNSIYKSCALLASKFGGVDFGNEAYDFFQKLENGTYRIVKKDVDNSEDSIVGYSPC